MKHLVAAHRTDKNRAIERHAEELDFHVDFRDIHQAARIELDMLVSADIGLQREIVVDAGRHVAPMRGRQDPVREFFKIHYTERFLGGGDGGGSDGLRGSSLRSGSLLGPGLGEQRAAREKT